MSKSLVEMTAEIVQAQINTTEMSGDEIKAALNDTFLTLKSLQEAEISGQPLELAASKPAMAPEKSIQRNQVVCLECGQSFKMLSPKHLKSHEPDPQGIQEKIRFFHAPAAVRQIPFRTALQVRQKKRTARKPEESDRGPDKEKEKITGVHAVRNSSRPTRLMIGIFDSGVGGMTVARAIEQLCPDLPLIYFGDIARTPYGSKSPDTIVRYSQTTPIFSWSRVPRLSSLPATPPPVRRRTPCGPTTSVPILDVITPATRKAAQVSAGGRIGIIGTRATIKSGIYPQRIREARPDAVVFSQACPLLVPLVEEGWLSQRETKMILRRYLHPLRLKKIDTLVLGCTHYPLLKHLIGPRIGNRVSLIDSSIEMALHVRDFLDNNAHLQERLRQQTAAKGSRFYVSDSTDAIEQHGGQNFRPAGRTSHRIIDTHADYIRKNSSSHSRRRLYLF